MAATSGCAARRNLHAGVIRRVQACQFADCTVGCANFPIADIPYPDLNPLFALEAMGSSVCGFRMRCGLRGRGVSLSGGAVVMMRAISGRSSGGLAAKWVGSCVNLEEYVENNLRFGRRSHGNGVCFSSGSEC